MTEAKQHLTAKDTARSEDNEDEKEEKKARMKEELQFRFNKGIIDELSAEDDEVITASKAATVEDIIV